jgi:hypothetical protein
MAPDSLAASASSRSSSSSAAISSAIDLVLLFEEEAPPRLLSRCVLSTRSLFKFSNLRLASANFSVKNRGKFTAGIFISTSIQLQQQQLTGKKCVYFYQLFVAYLKESFVSFGKVALQEAFVFNFL